MLLQYVTDQMKSLRNVSMLGSSNFSDESMKRLALGKKLRSLKIESKYLICLLPIQQCRRDFPGLEILGVNVFANKKTK